VGFATTAAVVLPIYLLVPKSLTRDVICAFLGGVGMFLTFVWEHYNGED
jgi:hypothetical protein